MKKERKLASMARLLIIAFHSGSSPVPFYVPILFIFH